MSRWYLHLLAYSCNTRASDEGEPLKMRMGSCRACRDPTLSSASTTKKRDRKPKRSYTSDQPLNHDMQAVTFVLPPWKFKADSTTPYHDTSILQLVDQGCDAQNLRIQAPDCPHLLVSMFQGV